MDNTLLPCPFCGSEAETFEASEDSFSILCTGCGVETPYLPYLTEAIAAWNRRAQPENKPLTLDELKRMDGEPVWIVEHPGWGHWELSYDAQDYIQDRDEDFYGMTCNAVKDGWCSGTCKYGLHNMGWIAYRAKPKEESK